MRRKLAYILSATLTLMLFSSGASGADDWASWEPPLARHPLTDLAGASVTLSEMRGQVVVVNFWASWCKPCKRELVRLDEWNRSLDGQTTRIVAVSIDTDREKVARFIHDKGLGLSIYHDGPDGLAAQLKLPSLPCSVVLDAWGRVVRVRGGGDDDTVRELRQTVDALLENRPAAVRAEEAG